MHWNLPVVCESTRTFSYAYCIDIWYFDLSKTVYGIYSSMRTRYRIPTEIPAERLPAAEWLSELEWNHAYKHDSPSHRLGSTSEPKIECIGKSVGQIRFRPLLDWLVFSFSNRQHVRFIPFSLSPPFLASSLFPLFQIASLSLFLFSLLPPSLDLLSVVDHTCVHCMYVHSTRASKSVLDTRSQRSN